MTPPDDSRSPTAEPDRADGRATIGRHAIVIGAGIAGLCAARAVADSFEAVSVIERDNLPPDAQPRPGTPQDRHAHALLVGGQRALSELFPGFEGDLDRAGAVRVRVMADVRLERPGFDSFPRHDLGLIQYAASRPLIEAVVRRRVQQHPRISFRTGCRVQEIVASSEGSAGANISGVRLQGSGARTDFMPADLVIDASGRGGLTLALLESLGRAAPPTTSIGIDRGCTTLTFAFAPGAEPDWKGLVSSPRAPQSSRSALIYPLEQSRWILSVSARHGDQPPREIPALLEFMRGLRTPTAFEAMRAARDLGEPAQHLFTGSEWRHFEQLESFPRGLLTIGDAICSFNPVYGQGMSVAAQEARLLQDLLGEAAAAPLARLAKIFFARARARIDSPWAMAAVPDLLYPQTRGQRPADFERSIAFARAVFELAADDSAVHAVMTRVAHLLEPRSAYREPALLARIEARMAQHAAQAASGQQR
jgi:2-polyprenyl-6-methoxyphenol hydroxylase-like FAD-dependent oxidoreductase